jgi:hypothetical protein
MIRCPKSTTGKLFTLLALLITLGIVLIEFLDSPGVGQSLNSLLASWINSIRSPPGKGDPPGEPPGQLRPLPLTPQEARGELLTVRTSRPQTDATGQRCVTVSATANKSGYFYLFNKNCEGKWFCLYPNKAHPDHAIAPGQDVTLDLKFRPPIGEETLVALFTSRPLRGVEHSELWNSAATAVTAETVPKLVKELRQRAREEDLSWEQASVTLVPDP